MRLRDTTRRKERMINMKIEKIEKVILNEDELLILEKAIDLIDTIYRAATQGEKVEKEASNILGLLTDFMDNNIELSVYKPA